MRVDNDRMTKDQWTHHGSKFVIGTLHGEKIEITAQYNPKELARQATASWTAHPNTAARHSKLGENHLWMEYGTTEPRTLTLELLFDGYEEGKPIAAHVENLERLTHPDDMSANVVSKEVDVIAMMKADGDKSDVDAQQSGYVSDSRTSRQMPYPPEDSKPTKVPTPKRTQPAPAPAPSNTVGTPSKKINPAALEGGPEAGPLYTDASPAPAPDAVSGADPAGPNAKTKAVYVDLE